MQDIDEITAIILQRAQKSGILLPDPVQTEYGFGWDPCTTVWIDNRRVHWYYNVFDNQFKEKQLSLVVEVAEINENRHVLRGITQSADSLFSIIELFLQRRISFQELEGSLPELRWRRDKFDQDKFIPHPPEESNRGNINSLFV